MCIIAAKPAGVAMPSPEQIEVMWHNNPDGGGIMYVKDGSVYIDKGYMCLADYMQRLDELRAQIEEGAQKLASAKADCDRQLKAKEEAAEQRIAELEAQHAERLSAAEQERKDDGGKADAPDLPGLHHVPLGETDQGNLILVMHGPLPPFRRRRGSSSGRSLPWWRCGHRRCR